MNCAHLNSIMVIIRNIEKCIPTNKLVMGHNEETIGNYFFTTIQNQH